MSGPKKTAAPKPTAKPAAKSSHTAELSLDQLDKATGGTLPPKQLYRH